MVETFLKSLHQIDLHTKISTLWFLFDCDSILLGEEVLFHNSFGWRHKHTHSLFLSRSFPCPFGS